MQRMALAIGINDLQNSGLHNSAHYTRVVDQIRKTLTVRVAPRFVDYSTFATLSPVLLPSFHGSDASILSNRAISNHSPNARSPVWPFTPFAIHMNLHKEEIVVEQMRYIMV